jgi:hypothetical protein
MESIVVVILTLNQRDRTLACLGSLLNEERPPFRILVWDNGSEDDTEKSVKATFPQVRVHYHPTNLGVASGRNAAANLTVERFNPTYLLFLDNDMLVEPGFIEGLLQPFLEDENVGQTQAKLRFMDDRSRINDGGGAEISFISWQVTPVGYGEIDRGQYDTVKRCVSCGGAMMVRTDVFEELNGFDTIFDPFGPEDLDFSLRLQEAGYLALYAPQAVAYHVVSHTYGKEYSEEYARHKTRHWFAFMRRHATPFQKLGFYLLGAPYLVIRVALREGRQGNLQAVRGLARGALDYAKSYLS